MKKATGGPKKLPRSLSPAAQRARAEARVAHERQAALRELSYFGKNICSICPHDRDQHVVEDGREVCLSCHDERLLVHQFKSMYRSAHEYFQRTPSGGIDGDPPGVLYYTQSPTTESAATTPEPGGPYMAVKTRSAPVPKATRPEVVKSAKPPKTRTAQAPEPEPDLPAANECGCGCGQATKSRFAPGHDAKLKSRLINAALRTDGETVKEAARAEKRLDQLDWTAHLDKAREARAAKAARDAERAAQPKGERTEKQKAATERMRAASKTKAAVVEDEEDEDPDVEDEIEDEIDDEDPDDEDEE